MRLFIPTIGQKLSLSSAWAFTLYNEYRNDVLRMAFGLDVPPHYTQTHDRHGYVSSTINLAPVILTFPAGTVLKIERIYLRRGKGDYDSITFSVQYTGVEKDPKLKKRFWVKLEDANTIICDLV